MAARVFDLKDQSKKRFDLFRQRCAGLARSKAQFDRNFLVNQDHIVVRGVQQNSSLRSAIQNEHIAAVIIQGRINQQTCFDGNPIEIAIDGVLKGFRYVEFQTSAATTEITLPRLQLRVVLREKRPRILIVTVHPMQDAIDETLPEVNYEIW